MDLILPNARIQLIISGGHDEILITSDNIESGAWPYDEPQTFKVSIARGNEQKWIADSFGKEALEKTEIVD